MPGTFVQRKFPVGTFDPRSENTGERKVPEPLLVLSLVLQCIRACSLVPDLVLHVKYFFYYISYTDMCHLFGENPDYYYLFVPEGNSTKPLFAHRVCRWPL